MTIITNSINKFHSLVIINCITKLINLTKILIEILLHYGILYCYKLTGRKGEKWRGGGKERVLKENKGGRVLSGGEQEGYRTGVCCLWRRFNWGMSALLNLAFSPLSGRYTSPRLLLLCKRKSFDYLIR